MDLDFDDDVERFRAEVRDFVRANLPADLRAKARRERVDLTPLDVSRWARILHDRGRLELPRLARRVRRTRLEPRTAVCLRAGTGAGRSAAAQPARRRHARPRRNRLRNARPEGALPAGPRQRRHHTLPGLFRAGCRLGPRRAGLPRRAQRRDLCCQRLQDLDPPTRSTPTGCSASSAPRPPAGNSRA